MLRSMRIRNGIRPFTRHRAGSLRDLNINETANNSLDESYTLDPEFNLNVLDFIPNEQGNGLFNKQSRARNSVNCSLLKKLFVIVILIVGASYQVLFMKNATILKSSNGLLVTKDCACWRNNKINLINVYTKINFLNEKLQSLSTALDETVKWRNKIAMENIKNESHQGKYKLLEQVNLKIENALNLYDADKVGMIDYALESAGGFVTSIPDTVPYPDIHSYNILGLITVQHSSNPRVLLQPETLPGQCFAFKGQSGRIRIKLARTVNIIAVTMEHAHPNLLPDMTDAPKDFKVYGLENADSESGDELGLFEYRLDRKHLQTFQIGRPNSRNKMYQYVELHILTNHGNLEYTCVYRFRVHGNK